MIGLIADDLTGASEVAGVCLEKRIPFHFFVGIPTVESLSKAAETFHVLSGNIRNGVLLVALDTRSRSMEEAIDAVSRTAANLVAAGADDGFKKVDSTLRGWVLPETRAMAAAFGRKSIIIEPANTRLDRNIRDGKYYISDLPLHKTAFSRDPEFPAFSSDVRELLTARAKGSPKSDIGFTVPDCMNISDQRKLLRRQPEGVLFAGSSGFWGEFLSHAVYESLLMPARGRFTFKSLLGFPEDDLDSADEFSLKSSLMVCGSAQRSSADFVAFMNGKGFPTVEIPDWMCLKEKPSSEQMQGWADGMAAKWQEDSRLILHFPPKEIPNPKYPHIKPTLGPAELRERMTEAVTLLLSRIKPEKLLIEGGATAYSLFEVMGWTDLKPVREWLLGVVEMETADGMDITLKPGSYRWPKFSW